MVSIEVLMVSLVSVVIVDLGHVAELIPDSYAARDDHLFHAFPVIELDSVNVIFDIDLSYRTWERNDFVCRDDGRVRNVMVMVIWLAMSMPTTNLEDIYCWDGNHDVHVLPLRFPQHLIQYQRIQHRDLDANGCVVGGLEFEPVAIQLVLN